MSKQLTEADYTIGWICALDVELRAATVMLDEIHKGLPGKRNIYTLGAIGKHNIVVACLPLGKYGTNSAAAVGTQMLEHFQSVRFGLLVGIGGGIFEKGIRLGDVVVGTPDDVYPGVVQSDLGKAESTGFRPTGALNTPPNILLSAAATLNARRDLGWPRLEEFIKGVRKKAPRLSKLFTPPAENSSSIWREPRENSVVEDEGPENHIPKIHYGLIASGNQVIKDRSFRDELNRRFNDKILCVEMEAAGLLYNFPCLVIRGICDYADSTKNDTWRDYAAIVAAGYAKELLQYIMPQDVESSERIRDVLDKNTQENVRQIRSGLKDIQEKHVLDWITDIDYGPQHYSNLQTHQAGTGQWILESKEYQKWLETSGQVLFCQGIPGAGKTIIGAVMIQDLFTRCTVNEQYGIAYMYLSYNQQDRLSGDAPVLSLLKQLISQAQSKNEATNLFLKHTEKKTRPASEEIYKALSSTFAQFLRVFIVIDGLDECSTYEYRIKLLDVLFQLQTQHRASICVTSRFTESLTEKFKDCINLKIRAQEADVAVYINTKLQFASSAVIRNNSALKERIRIGIAGIVGEMFLLAKLYVEAIESSTTEKKVDDTLAEIRAEYASLSGEKYELLSRAYNRILERIWNQNPEQLSLAKRMLSWIIHAKGPLTTRELSYALAIQPWSSSIDSRCYPHIEDMLSICAGLVVVDQESQVIRLVHHTAQEFLKTKETQTGLMLPDGELLIAEACTTYLSFQNCDRNDPLYAYATKNWGHHARHATMLVTEVENFLLTIPPTIIQAIMHGWENWWENWWENGWDNESNLSITWPHNVITALHVAAAYGLSEVAERLVTREGSTDGIDSFGRTPLIWAATQGHEAIFKILIHTKGVDVNFRDEYWGRTPLSWAVKNGHLNIVRTLLEKDALPNTADALGQSTMSLAVKNGNAEIVGVLLRGGATVVSKNLSKSPLYLAIRYNHAEVTKLLLGHGAQPDSIDGRGQTPSFHAITHGFHYAVELLLEISSTKPDHRDKLGNTALHLAAESGDVELARRLIQAGCGYETRNLRDQTPLFRAVQSGHEKAVQLFCDLKASTNFRVKGGLTPLHVAAKTGHINILNLLLAHGADPNAVDHCGNTPLLCAASNGCEGCFDSLLDVTRLNDQDFQTLLVKVWLKGLQGNDKQASEMLKKLHFGPQFFQDQGLHVLFQAVSRGRSAMIDVLIGRGFSIADYRDRNGRSILSLAAAHGHLKMVEVLLRCRQFNLDCKYTHIAESPLWESINNGHLEIVPLLLSEEQLELNFPNQMGFSPLLWASSEGREGIVSLILKHEGVDVNFTDQNGQTSLHHAAKNGHDQVPKLLLAFDGLSINSSDACGRTPLSVAAENGHANIVNILLRERHIDPVSEDPNGNGPLILAVRNGHAHLVELLLADMRILEAYRVQEKAMKLANATANTTLAVLEVFMRSDL
ncbi:uncharacterized protein KD926_008380 [Aspergillus affinis]|uniref:uncharacterized protein n=1 Tax=Aspergillus affinis TaxID=1070780 RepID=UPI0022FE8B1E|nr:uncharacterized protein KD926_008380 [Aspergillus affinis]KAI9040290.1 hypothetical protein KD926_008380 [Aspergillus affinis]